MGLRGKAPARQESLKHKSKARPSNKLTPEDAESVPYVDFDPEPPPADESWHPLARKLFEAMKSDPSRVWMGSAGWATTLVMCETLSRELSPQIVEWEITNTTIPGSAEIGDGFIDATPDVKVTTRTPIMGTKTVSAGTLTALLKWMAVVGINEGDRMRISQEVTFGTAPPSLAETYSPELSLVRSEALSG